jgi:hypothetical protein
MVIKDDAPFLNSDRQINSDYSKSLPSEIGHYLVFVLQEQGPGMGDWM